MANVAHSTLTGSNLHEPRGADTAAAGEVYVANGSGSGAWTASGTVVTGMIADFYTPIAPTGWLELNGAAVSTTTYASLYTALTIQQTGSRGSGSALITGLTSTANMKIGYYIFGTGINVGTKILSVDSSTQVTMDANAVSSGSNTVIVSPCALGVGTFTLPDLTTVGRYRRSRASSLQIGLTQGDQNQSHTHTGLTSFSGSHGHTVTISDPSHTHTIDSGGAVYLHVAAGGVYAAGVGGTGAGSVPTAQNAFTGISATVDTQGSHDHSLSMSTNGGTEARPLTLVVMTCIKT